MCDTIIAFIITKGVKKRKIFVSTFLPLKTSEEKFNIQNRVFQIALCNKLFFINIIIFYYYITIIIYYNSFFFNVKVV